MNRLELRYVPMPNQPVATDQHGTEPIIDGTSLLDIFGREQYTPAVGVEFPSRHLNLWGEARRAGTIEILSGIPEQSRGYVTPLIVEVTRTGSTVSWSGLAGDPYVFDLDGYDAELARHQAELDRRIPLVVRALDAIWMAFNELKPAKRRMLIGIVGAPGSGKSTLTAELVASWPHRRDAAVALPMDGFHLSTATLERLGRRDRMGAPDTFDVEAFVSTLEAARDIERSLLAPGFDRTLEEPVPYAITIPAEARFVIVEGNYLLHDRDGWERVRPLLDTVIYLAPDDAVRRERLIARHIAFGKTPAEAEEWVSRSDDPNAALIAETVYRADRILR